MPRILPDKPGHDTNEQSHEVQPGSRTAGRTAARLVAWLVTHAPAQLLCMRHTVRRARSSRSDRINGAAAREIAIRWRAKPRYAKSNAGLSGGHAEARSTQPRPTASYARRSTSTPFSIDPSGRLSWISAFIPCAV